MIGLLYCIAIGVIIGVVWSARKHETTGGFLGFVYKIIEVSVWGSLAGSSGYIAYLFWVADMYSGLVLFGLMSVLLSASPLYVICSIISETWYHFFPHPATKSMYGSARIR